MITARTVRFKGSQFTHSSLSLKSLIFCNCLSHSLFLLLHRSSMDQYQSHIHHNQHHHNTFMGQHQLLQLSVIAGTISDVIISCNKFIINLVRHSLYIYANFSARSPWVSHTSTQLFPLGLPGTLREYHPVIMDEKISFAFLISFTQCWNVLFLLLFRSGMD